MPHAALRCAAALFAALLAATTLPPALAFSCEGRESYINGLDGYKNSVEDAAGATYWLTFDTDLSMAAEITVTVRRLPGHAWNRGWRAWRAVAAGS